MHFSPFVRPKCAHRFGEIGLVMPKLEMMPCVIISRFGVLVIVLHVMPLHVVESPHRTIANSFCHVNLPTQI